MHTLLKSTLIVTAIAPSMVFAQAVNGDREVTISGQGQSDKDLDNNAFSMTASYGQYINDRGQIGVRQSLSLADREGDSTDIDGATVGYYDHHFGQGQMRPFIGANLGFNYGDRTEETFSAGPEAGLKYYVLEKTFIQGMVQYQFLFEGSSDVDDNYDDGILYYSVGMGFNF
ncbi:hypothetical protein SAMN05216203_0318 [Marinobacter daqiaonensis]|uniref:Outer membrane protein beta-barrel domain-containing protein n=1 Tax=Marinobacter daqiaonensis TaxID=650891 RepID=A0A1I6GNN0_9GAMM|nr:hypothetical protein [Marinobacter daqiaonensis]SFR43804.1 hypothetical protein SAMN05216203_0318 [Marinobacter daqiaonensis]